MSERIRILFVDDEPNVLESMRRMLCFLDEDWESSFAEGGEAALALMEQQAFDVVVSDIRMPGMDGTELLGIVKERYPHAGRIALSGQTSQEHILRAVGPIHQFLPKPCDEETLVGTIKQLCALRSVLNNRKIQEVVSQMEKLPSLPALYGQLMEELQKEGASMKTIADIIGRDVGMSVKLLKLVNSSFFGVKQRVTEIEQAVKLLGLETVGSLVLSAKIFATLEQDRAGGWAGERLWEHSLEVSQLGRALVRAQGLAGEGHDFAAITGMVHDIGQLILGTHIPELYEQRDEREDITGREREALGTTHAEVGAFLLGLWGFPPAMVEAVAYHHRPGEAGKGEVDLLTVLTGADVLSRGRDASGSVAAEVAYMEEVLGEEGWRGWQETAGSVMTGTGR